MNCLRGGRSVFVLVFGFFALGSGSLARANEVWVAPTYQADIGGLGIGSNTIWPVTSFGIVRLAWSVPNDLQTFQTAKVVLIPNAPGGAATLNVVICPAQNANPVIGACAGPFAQAFTGIANQLLEVDISAIVGPRVGTPGMNYLSVLAFTTPTTASDHILGLRFAYDPVPPTGTVATNFSNVALGSFALGNHPTGSSNTGLGEYALASNGSGAANTAVGHRALLLNTTGIGNTAVGTGANRESSFASNNTALGTNALGFLFSGNENTAVGTEALMSHADAVLSANTGVGYRALTTVASGQDNTAVGHAALSAVEGSGNIGIGKSAGINLLTGFNNIYVGHPGAAFESNTVRIGTPGVQNRAFIAGIRGVTPGNADVATVVIDSAGQLGTVSPSALATLGTNTFSGTQTAPMFSGSFSGNGSGLTNLPVPSGVAGLGANTFSATQTIDNGNVDLDPSTASVGNITKNGTRFLHNFGTNNTFLGLGAGNLTMTGGENTAVGANALSANTSAINNTAIGSGSLNVNTEGTRNTGTGVHTMLFNTTGSDNTATGAGAMTHNTTGRGNSAHGSLSLLFNTTGRDNTATGVNALSGNVTGSSNTALGAYALQGMTAGDYNVAVGYFSGGIGSSGSNNIYLGSNIRGVDGESNAMYLGNTGPFDAVITKTVIAGVRGTTTGVNNAIPVLIDSNGQLGTVSSSIRFKEDVQSMGDTSRRLLQLRPVTFRYKQPYADGGKPVQYGLVAEEVADVFPELAVRNGDGQVETVHYETLNVLLLNELQRQERLNQEQQERIDALEQRLNELLNSGQAKAPRSAIY